MAGNDKDIVVEYPNGPNCPIIPTCGTYSVNGGDYQGNRDFQGKNSFPIVGNSDLRQYCGRCDLGYRCEGRTKC